MGLTIYYKLSVEKNLTVAVVRELAERAAQYAQKIGCAEVSDILRANSDVKSAPLFVCVGKPENGCFDLIPVKRGWLVEVWPGEGCESATFGLCQYPRRIPYRAGSVDTGFDGGWLLKGSCKTQHANEHGWEHFLKCHRQIISLLEFWRELGVTVESPIFDYANFERLEHEGRLEFGRQVDQLRKETGKGNFWMVNGKPDRMSG